MIKYRARVYLLPLIAQGCNCLSVDSILNVNTYANSVIESLLALVMFMEVLRNVNFS